MRSPQLNGKGANNNGVKLHICLAKTGGSRYYHTCMLHKNSMNIGQQFAEKIEMFSRLTCLTSWRPEPQRATCSDCKALGAAFGAPGVPTWLMPWVKIEDQCRPQISCFFWVNFDYPILTNPKILGIPNLKIQDQFLRCLKHPRVPNFNYPSGIRHWSKSRSSSRLIWAWITIQVSVKHIYICICIWYYIILFYIN